MKIIPVILSGGSGTRLWPLSRKQYPKQFLPLVGKKTVFQETILRLKGLDGLAEPIIICNEDHRFLVAEQCQQINVKNPTILLEPIGRNTAPAIAAAAIHLDEFFDDAILLVLSSDHVIKDIDAFHRAINIGRSQALTGKLVTLGIVPENANTSFGYIRSSKIKKNGAYSVEEFVEKPDQETAKRYFNFGNYLWNSGMFMFKTSSIIEELSIHSHTIIKAVKMAVKNSTKDLDFIRLDQEAFESSPSDSIDYALMEKSKNVVVVPLNAQWSDIGSWSTLYDISSKDKNGNVISGDVITQDTTSTFIKTDHNMIVTIGVKNLIIVDTPDVTLIATKDKVLNVKQVVEELKQKGRYEEEFNRKVYRPWGWYDSIDKGDRFQVKRICVNPGASLSLQKHTYRAEHWIIVKGSALVTNGNKTELLIENQSTFIPVGTLHRLENPGKLPLEMIEVQSGSYLGEDDIERFEDSYGRT
jgi:mannose-1-phosphate guanylyltransferase / mannose-6-phosphate isomerase